MTKNTSFRTVGIIAEYNPIHNGHAYHIREAKKLANADYCVVALSGDFVQRGEPALYDNYTRTAMALSCGADLVLELPSVFATSSAEDFASCGVALLTGLGVVHSLCFGSECGNVEKLSRIASILAAEPAPYTETLRRELKKGRTFPKARSEALISCGLLSKEEEELFAAPNNLLGIEYCKALGRQNSPLRPLTVVRKGAGYHKTEISFSSSGNFDDASRSDGLSGSDHLDRFASALAIRRTLAQAFSENAGSKFPYFSTLPVPRPVREIMEQSHPLFPRDFSLLLNAQLLRLAREQTPYSNYLDVSQELAARIAGQLPDLLPFDEKIQALKTRQYTYTRISRALTHLILEITSELAAQGREAGYAPYGRVLGFRRASAALMGEIKKRGTIPLITKTAGAENRLAGTARNLLLQDFHCSHIYQSLVQNKYGCHQKNEFTRSVVML